jgi:tight adherence protein B
MAAVAPGFWQPLESRLTQYATRYAANLESAGLQISPVRFVATVSAIAFVSWVVLVVALRPDPAIAVLLLVPCGAVCAFGGRLYLKRRRNRRIAQFRDQLEGALRTLSGAVRVGLGIRQALVLTSEQCREPAKTEFMRVVALSNLGMSVLDAFDQLALRMDMSETAVLARVIRVQSQTGGDLGSVLEGLAGTIRDRRRLRRRVSAITSQGRATAWLLGLLPILVGCFVLTQGQLRDAMLDTTIGRILLAVALGLDVLAVASLGKIVQINP